MSKDYYKTLGVSKSATKEDIKKAYRKLAHQCHPDKAGGDESRFKEINEAYSVLGNEQKRSQYDTYGNAFNGGSQGGYGGFSQGGFDFNNFSSGGSVDLGDIFETFFSGQRGGRPRYVKRGRDISIDIELPFEEAVFGAERTIVISKISTCDKCEGEGSAPGSEVKKCDFCQGTGRIRETKKSFFGSFVSEAECNKCLGKGSIPTKKCGSCHGNGVKPTKEDIKINVPPGIENGEMIKMSGGGEAVSQGVNGDLYIKIHVREHNIFRREGPNMFMDLDIKISDALLGAEKEIKTLDGVVKLKIPAGINSGEVLKLRDRGATTRSGIRGDLMVRVLVKSPNKLSKKAKEIIEELKKEGI